jgi:hypothetical protein
MICNNATWEEVSSYVAERFAADNVHRDLKKHPIFRELSLGDLSIPLDERIRKVIEYTQNEIIYLYDAEVMHGHFPQDPETTLERRAGDCKAKSLLLIDLLATLGIDADFILVNTESDNLLKRTTPTPFVFNHAIVRIKKDEKEYFVDPTWTYRAGVLGKRTEPLFFHYLVVAHNMDLSTRNEILLGDPVLKEEISVIIRKGEAKILILSKCMRASADNFRIILNRGGIAEVTRVWSTYIMQYLSYSEQKSVDTLFTDITLKVISDDQSENKIEVRHELTLPNAYQLANGTRVFKFYHPLASGEIRNFAHRDAPCVHFAGYPVKQVLVIDSDYFIKDDNTTKKTLTLSNNYFDFSNKKKTTLKKITVTTEYTPKKYALISSDELEEIQLAYQKIDDSNNGVGVVFISIPEFIKKQWYLCLVLIWLLLAFLKFLH